MAVQLVWNYTDGKWRRDGGAGVDVSVLSSSEAACVRHGGFVAGAERFDAGVFGVSVAARRRMHQSSLRWSEW